MKDWSTSYILKYIRGYLPFLSWAEKLKEKGVLQRDIIAGISVGLILIPQSMAYADLAGLPIYVGLYTAFLPVIVGALFGSSGQMSTWPVTIVSLMTATALAPIASSGTEWYIVYASLLAFFTGTFYILLWCLRLGVIVDFLSHPVIVWFTNAVAIVTITSQISKIFGVSVDKWSTYIHYIVNLLYSISSNTDILTFTFGLFSIIFLLLSWKFFPKLPRILIVLLLSITVSYIIWFHENYGWSIIWSIPSQLPGFFNPLSSDFTFQLSFYEIFKLWVFSIIIGLIGFTESISVAKFVSYKTKQRVSANRELIWQWLANITSSFFGWYGVAGSFSKTAVNLKAWAKTGLSSIVTGLMVWGTLLFFTPVLYYIPTATLAAIIIVAVLHMIRFKPLIKSWKIEKHDGIIGFTTFFLTLWFVPDIDKWILIWVLLSLILFIYRSMRPKVTEVALYKDGTYRDIDLFWLQTSKDISVYRFDGSLYFANAGFFESEILDYISSKKKIRCVILDMEWINNIDSSAEEILHNLVNRLDNNGVKVYLTGIRTKVLEKLQKSGFMKEFENKRIFTKIEDALEKIEKKYDGKIDIKHLIDYKRDKKKNPELEKEVIKKIEKIS